MRKNKFYFNNKENCYQISLLCVSRREFYIKYPAAARSSKKNEWIDEFFPRKKKLENFWTYEMCKQESLKYSTKKELKEKCETAYKKILKNKWDDELFKHMDVLGNFTKRLIYAQEFPDRSVYIGLTGNIKQRCKNHFTIKRETVYKHIIKTGTKPTLKILTDYLPIKDSIKNEKNWVEKYKKDGWLILNLVKTGGIGGSKRKWNIDTLSMEALKYNTKSEFKKNSYNAYCVMYKYKYQNIICNHMVKSYKPVLQYTLDGLFIKKFESSGFAHRETNIIQGNICSCCNGKYKTAGGFIWKYES